MVFPKQQVIQWINERKEEVVEIYKSILRIPALAPKNGGDGEWDKAQKIIEIITAWGWKDWLEVVEVPDPKAKNQSRPNLIITYNPENLSSPAIISVSHMDIVPVGDLTEWDHDPFDPLVKDGKLFGRGTEDNGQGLICSLYGLKCIVDLKLTIANPIKVVIVADEELGSTYGIRPLVEQNRFSADDIVVVPDAGVKSGLEIEVAEKKPFQVHIITEGHQGHAARPNDALNTQPVANALASRLYEELHTRFTESDPLFYPPVSTFEPTKRVNNVENTNTLPGRDEQWWDCRLLPDAPVEEIKKVFLTTAAEIEKKWNAKITVNIRTRDIKIPTINADTQVVQRMQKAIGTMIEGKTTLVGIGGGTCAAFFRMAGIKAIVWGHMDHTAHETNEYCVVENLYTDIAIFTAFFME